MFIRFGNPSQLPSVLKKDYMNFAQHFVTTFAPEIFKVYLHQIELFISDQVWLSRKCSYQIFSFLTEWYANLHFYWHSTTHVALAASSQSRHGSYSSHMWKHSFLPLSSPN